jgi:aldehyde dehydrogenase (NAD+)
VYVARERYDELASALVARAQALRPGHGLRDDVDFGPVVNRAAMDDVLAACDRAATEGEVLAGGSRLLEGELERGWFVAPTVVAELPRDAELACREVFGPVVALWPVDDDEEAIAAANATEYGLSAAVFTRDLGAAKAFVERIEAGLVHVNSQTAGADVHVPFGGLKASAHGPHEQGRAAIDFYTDQQTVYLDAAS